MTREIRLFGLSEEALRHRLADLLDDGSIAVTLSVYEGHGTVTLTADDEVMEELTAEVTLRLSGYVYSETGESLAACVVRLLTAHGLTVATAESCTGGLIAAALTDVPGASKVLGTGVVSYSNACKEQLLQVSPDTLAAVGAVSAETAGQMARGVRQIGAASIGVSVTGEAGPTPAEDWPVGTVFLALADKKRTWVEELHLDGPDRASIRRQAADRVLWLLWRYLSAYPAVMAGGETHYAVRQREIPRTQGAAHPRLLSRILPWRGDSRRRLLLKCVAWLAVLAVLCAGLYAVYLYLSESDRNRELQSSLGKMYWESTDLTEGASSSSAYPKGMLPAYRGLYGLNEDISGWLYIEGTGVDYPVMKEADGYYRNHSFMRQYSTYGQLYFGASASQRVTCVYGQNPRDGQMLSDLLSYRRLAYLQSHATVKCSTLTADETWQIFAVLVVDDDHPEFSYLPEKEWNTDEDFLEYVEQLRERSLFTSNCPVFATDRVLLLTTEAEEEYGKSGARLVIAARQSKGEQPTVTYRVNQQAKMPAFLATTTRRLTTTTTTAPATTVTTTATTVTETVVTPESTTETVTTTQSDTTTAPTTSTVDSTTSTEESVVTETVEPTEGTTIPTEETGADQ